MCYLHAIIIPQHIRNSHLRHLSFFIEFCCNNKLNNKLSITKNIFIRRKFNPIILRIYIYIQNIIQHIFACSPGVQASELEPLVGGTGPDRIDGMVPEGDEREEDLSDLKVAFRSDCQPKMLFVRFIT